MTACPVHPADEVEAETNSVLCTDCQTRLWSEIHWLADVYNPLFEALTRRLNVEKVEQAVVAGARDPLATGIDLNDDAVAVRGTIRGLSLSGLSWAASRIVVIPEQWDDSIALPDTADTPGVLRWLARNLVLITSDREQPYQVRHWASEVVRARVAAERLLTPRRLKKEYYYAVETVRCWADVGDQDQPQLCTGQLGVWMVDGRMQGREMVCTMNPGHVYSFKEVQTQAIQAAKRGREAAALIRQII